MPAAITWLGHATVLVELDGLRVLTDPVLRSRVGPLVRIAAPVAADAVRDLDAVLVSHLHADHADLGSLRQLGSGTRLIAPPGAAEWLRRRGFAHVTELAPGRSTRIGAVTVTAVPAEHDGRRGPLGPHGVAVGFVLHDSHSVYFAGDTDLFPGMAELDGQVDVALLPVWGWGPKLGRGHLDPERAAEAARRIAPRLAIPIHWGTLTAPWRFYRPRPEFPPAQMFAARAAERAPAVEVRILSPGECTELP